MTLSLDLQIATTALLRPSEAEFCDWVTAALQGMREHAELTVRLVDEVEGEALNRQFRSKAYATNVLSFPFQAPEVVSSDLLGDLVICVPVVTREAEEQGKAVSAHWAHMVVHGTLHLLGCDHQTADEALSMERLETSIMAELGFPDPYREDG